MFFQSLSNLGKLLKIPGKVSFQNFPKLPWERKGKGKLSVLPIITANEISKIKATIDEIYLLFIDMILQYLTEDNKKFHYFCFCLCCCDLG